MSHSPLKNVPSANLQKFTNWQMEHFSVASVTFIISCFLGFFWFNLINIPIFSIYYTYICSNINNLSEKEPKTPEKPIFLRLRLRITAWGPPSRCIVVMLPETLLCQEVQHGGPCNNKNDCRST